MCSAACSPAPERRSCTLGEGRPALPGFRSTSASGSVVIPLVVTQLLAAIVRPEAGSSLGKLGGKAIVLFVAMLLGAGVLTLLVTERFLAVYAFSPELVEAFRSVAIPETAQAAVEAGSPPQPR